MVKNGFNHRVALTLLGLALFGGLIYLLSPILLPFLIAAILAYLGDPIVVFFVKKGLPRTLAAALVFFTLMLLITLLPLLLVPALQTQLTLLLEKLPIFMDWLQQLLGPVLNGYFTEKSRLNLSAVTTSNLAQAGSVLASVWGMLTYSGAVFLNGLIKIFLVIIVTFYLLRDWDLLIVRCRQLLPRALAPKISQFARECDDVLSVFLRGQLLVMLVLSILYSIGLTLAGLQLSLLVGTLAGLLSFIPYLGLITGIALASIAVLVQFHDWLHLLYVLIVFAIVHGLEVAVLVPWLIGDKIGLHPVTVIFAILVGGQLFGFMGILLALPVAAIAVVFFAYAKRYYFSSKLYNHPPGEDKPCPPSYL